MSAPSSTEAIANPVPQALSLTAIVISFGLTLFLLSLAVRQRLLTGEDLVEDDLEEARAANDLARIELAERDRDFLVAELSQGLGLGGRLRSTGSDAEKARGSVGRCLRYALDELADELPGLAAHLDASLRTGTYCCYDPDPLVAVDWDTGG